MRCQVEVSASGRSLNLEESYRLRCVVVCDLENLVIEEAVARCGAVVPKTNIRCDPVEVCRQTQIMQESIFRFRLESAVMKLQHSTDHEHFGMSES